MANIIKSNGKRNLSYSDEELISKYDIAKKRLTKMEEDFLVAEKNNDKEAMSTISFYRLNCKELILAYELEIKYRELEMGD